MQMQDLRAKLKRQKKKFFIDPKCFKYLTNNCKMEVKTFCIISVLPNCVTFGHKKIHHGHQPRQGNELSNSDFESL